jgi:hypothetical protein
MLKLNIVKVLFGAQHWWPKPVILAAQEAEIRRIEVQSQPWQIVLKNLSRKYPTQKRAGMGSG